MSFPNSDLPSTAGHHFGAKTAPYCRGWIPVYWILKLWRREIKTAAPDRPSCQNNRGVVVEKCSNIQQDRSSKLDDDEKVLKIDIIFST
jgi:hypothetical protein